MDTSQDSAAYAEDREARIRERAREIWENQGQPEGKDLEHWMEAEKEFGYDTPLKLDENISVLGKPDNASGSGTSRN